MRRHREEVRWERRLRLSVGAVGVVLLGVGALYYIFNGTWEHGAAVFAGMGGLFVVLAAFAPVKWLENL
jgi:hypothetical protein